MPGALAAGQLVDERYALEERLGEDALGTIWRAQDRGLGRTVCLRDVRFLFQDRAHRQEALMAGRTAIRVDHPGAVHVWDAFIDGDHLVMVTELVSHRSLADLVGSKGKLPPKRVAAIGLEVLEPLVAAHAAGVPHGSMSPANVLLPEKAPARITGFGLAPAFRDAAAYEWVEVAGTASCVSPEQAGLRGNSATADLWSLGATLFYAVEGKHAFKEETPAATLAAISADPLRLPERPNPLTPLLKDMLAKHESSRPTVDEVRRRLADVAGVSIEPPAAEARSRRRTRKDRRTAAEEAEEVLPAEEEEHGEHEEEEHDWNVAMGAVEWSDGPEGSSDLWLPPAEGQRPAEPEPQARPPLALVPDPPVEGAVGAAQSVEPATADPPPVPAEVEVERRFRAFPSWPPPPKRRIGLTLLSFMVMVVMVGLLVTNGRILGRSDESDGGAGTAQNRPVLKTDPNSVPKEWITYRHPRVNYGVSHPAGWTLREEGSVVTIREPTTNAQLRIDYKQPPGPDPEGTWRELEASFSSQHADDYRRLQLSPASYLEQPAALWEFTFVNDANVSIHAVDLGFTTKKYGFALYFEAPSASWQQLLPTFNAFLSSFRIPK